MQQDSRRQNQPDREEANWRGIGQKQPIVCTEDADCLRPTASGTYAPSEGTLHVAAELRFDSRLDSKD